MKKMHFVDMVDISAMDLKVRLSKVVDFLSEYYGQHAQDVAGSTGSKQQNALSKKSFMRAKQLAHCYFNSHNVDPDALTNIPKNVCKQITEALFPSVITPQQTPQDDDGETVKTLYCLSTGKSSNLC